MLDLKLLCFLCLQLMYLIRVPPLNPLLLDYFEPALHRIQESMREEL